MKYIELNDGNRIPALGFGVFMIPGDGPTYEATLAALPAPELPAPVSIEPAPVAEPAPDEKPKRRRKTVVTEEPAVPAEVAAEEPPAKPARKRKAKAAEAEGGETA